MSDIINKEEAAFYAKMHRDESNLARCYLSNLEELNKLRAYYETIVCVIGHDSIIKEYSDRGELLRQETQLRKTVQESNRVLLEELALMRGRLEEESTAHENTMIERDNAEDMCDKMTSALLDEPIDCQFHDQKWQDGLLAVKSMHREIQFLRSSSARSSLEASIIMRLLDREYEEDLSDYETPLTERVKQFVKSVDEQVAVIQKELQDESRRLDYIINCGIITFLENDLGHLMQDDSIKHPDRPVTDYIWSKTPRQAIDQSQKGNLK